MQKSRSGKKSRSCFFALGCKFVLVKATHMVLILKKGASKKEIEVLREKLSSLPGRKKTMEAHKYLGTIKLKEDPLVIQKKLRDEWE